MTDSGSCAGETEQFSIGTPQSSRGGSADSLRDLDFGIVAGQIDVVGDIDVIHDIDFDFNSGVDRKELGDGAKEELENSAEFVDKENYSVFLRKHDFTETSEGCMDGGALESFSMEWSATKDTLEEAALQTIEAHGLAMEVLEQFAKEVTEEKNEKW
eukprot:TRINITY_DN69924_c0_g1_i1.p2 TRINITY_DN69924_c0_g1~~TRINITY_DN69924_c0_g1_i1.p2  ORF type:complete len:157 (+),score=48.88 TRINITY_DN69924_c0_g1_i1:1069-1539(+)